jgi:3-dehydroquinate dehydratase/shikimate dehydrogenase
MGDMGIPSRILAGKYNAPFTYATFNYERALAPGQLSYQQMTEIYDYDSINAETEIFGVIADPIAHSLSPFVHNSAYRELGMNRVYIPFRVPREELSSFLEDCKELGVKGLSVTIPHKEAIMEYVTDVNPIIAEIGAVNTVLFDGDVLTGYNTDLDAAMKSLLKVVGKTGAEKPLAGRKALILGAGGAARAIGFGLKQNGCDISLSARRLSRANELAYDLDCPVVNWEERHKVKANIIVNATPVGMHPNVNSTPYDQEHLHRTTVVFDAVYNPEQTLLIKQAREQSCRVITGVDMFVRQAAQQFKLFTGTEAPIDLMRRKIKHMIGAARF